MACGKKEMDKMERYTHKDWRLYAENDIELAAGNFYISVTTILSIICGRDERNFMITSSPDYYKSIMETASDTGTQIHKAIQADLLGQPYSTEGIEKPIENWKKLKEKHNLTATTTEIQVVSEEYGYAGTLDWEGTIENEPAVFELKSGLYQITAGWQLAAYKHCLDPENKKKMVGVQVHRNGKDFGIYRYQYVDACFKAFLSALNCFRMYYYNELKRLDWKFLNGGTNGTN